MNKTCEWRQLQCIVLWDSRNLLFFSLKRHSGTNLCLKLPPSPTHPPVRQSDAEMIDRQGPEVGESQKQPWEKSATSGEMLFRGKIRQKCRKIFRDFFHVCSWAGELSKLFQSGLPLSRVPSLQPYFDIVKKCEIFSQLLSFSYPYFTLNNLLNN